MIRAASSFSALWKSLPLCRSYRLAHFEAMSVPLSNAAADALSALWVLGALGDSQVEIAGPWLAERSADDLWEQAINDLRARGVEKIACISAQSELPSRPLLAASLPLGPRSRRANSGLDAAASEARDTLRRIVDRHGPFDNREGAVARLTRALQLAEERISLGVPLRVPGHLQCFQTTASPPALGNSGR